MEFTKENVIKLLTDVETTIRQLGERKQKDSEEADRPLKDWKEGLAVGLIESANYIKDTIYLIKEYMITTEDLIDKENRK